MKKLILGLSLAALAAGSAYAVEAQRPSPDADGNGIITRAEAEARSARMFARLDVNKDGKIDAADRAARENARFDAMDTNKDGQLSRAEFAAPRQHPGMDGPMGGPGMEDDHGPGPMGHGRHGPHRGGIMGGMHKGMADANHDGAITQAEFTAAAMQRFDRMDANKDGQVTKEERQAMWKQMRADRDAPPPPPAN